MPSVIYSSFAGGMDSASQNHRLMAPDCCSLIVNGTVRSGFIEPRPSFTKIGMSWMDDRAQHLFERGVYQGSFFYTSDRGPMLLYAFDGHVLALDVESGQMRFLTSEAQPFSRYSEFVWFAQRGPYAVAQDGVSPPLIIRGLQARQGTKNTEVPCGTMMIDGWGRLAVVSPDRTRIYFSNHEADPTSNSVLNFTEGTAYFKNARYFQIPGSLGRVTGIEFAPSFYGKADLGPLVVFCENGTRAFDISVPRSQWTSQDISTTPLPSFGSCAHGSIVRRGNDLIFSDQLGHIQTMKAAMRRDEDSRMAVIDKPVYDWFKSEERELRRWRQSVRFDDRILTTINPYRDRKNDGRFAVAHRHLAVLNELHAPTNQEHVWDGLWSGIDFVSLDVVNINGSARCLTVASSNGINSLFEIQTEVTGIDIGSKASGIVAVAALKPVDFDDPFRTKGYEGGALKVGNMRGDVEISGWWSADRGVPSPWFTDSRSIDYATCEAAANPHQMPRINAPSPPRGKDRFAECQPWVQIQGMARLEGLGIDVGEPAPTPNRMTTRGRCQPEKTAVNTDCAPNPFAYAITT